MNLRFAIHNFRGAVNPPERGVYAASTSEAKEALVLIAAFAVSALKRRKRRAPFTFHLASFVIALLLTATTLHAAPTQKPADEIPPLAPPLPEIQSTFWERHPILKYAFPGLVTGLALGLWQAWANRKKTPPKLLAPAAQARAALAALQNRPENGATLSEISKALRRYLITAFWLRPEEMTTTEFCAALAAHKQIGPELSAALSEFLRGCDERKFSLAVNPPVTGAAGRALELVQLAEVRRAKLREPAQAGQNT